MKEKLWLAIFLFSVFSMTFSSPASAWMTGWNSRKNFTITETNGTARWNEQVFENATDIIFSNLNEIRVADDAGNELPREILINGTTWVAFNVPANVSAYGSKNFSTYYNNPIAGVYSLGSPVFNESTIPVFPYQTIDDDSAEEMSTITQETGLFNGYGVNRTFSSENYDALQVFLSYNLGNGIQNHWFSVCLNPTVSDHTCMNKTDAIYFYNPLNTSDVTTTTGQWFTILLRKQYGNGSLQQGDWVDVSGNNFVEFYITTNGAMRNYYLSSDFTSDGDGTTNEILRMKYDDSASETTYYHTLQGSAGSETGYIGMVRTLVAKPLETTLGSEETGGGAVPFGITINAPVNTTYNDARILINLTANGDANFSYSFDNGITNTTACNQATTCQVYYDLIDDGTFTLTAYGVNSTNSSETSSSSVTFTLVQQIFPIELVRGTNIHETQFTGVNIGKLMNGTHQMIVVVFRNNTLAHGFSPVSNCTLKYSLDNGTAGSWKYGGTFGMNNDAYGYDDCTGGGELIAINSTTLLFSNQAGDSLGNYYGQIWNLVVDWSTETWNINTASANIKNSLIFLSPYINTTAHMVDFTSHNTTDFFGQPWTTNWGTYDYQTETLTYKGKIADTNTIDNGGDPTHDRLPDENKMIPLNNGTWVSFTRFERNSSCINFATDILCKLRIYGILVSNDNRTTWIYAGTLPWSNDSTTFKDYGGILAVLPMSTTNHGEVVYVSGYLFLTQAGFDSRTVVLRLNATDFNILNQWNDSASLGNEGGNGGIILGGTYQNKTSIMVGAGSGLSSDGAEFVWLKTMDMVTPSPTSYISVTFEYSSVAYGSLSAGSSDNVALNQGNGIYNVTIDTNQNYQVNASGINFTDGSHDFNVNNLKVDTNSTAGNLLLGSAVALSNTPQLIDDYLYTDTINYHGFWLSIPSGQYANSYSSTVTISYMTV